MKHFRWGALLTRVALVIYPSAFSADRTADGSPVSLAPNGQYNPRAISDGAGGAIIACGKTLARSLARPPISTRREPMRRAPASGATAGTWTASRCAAPRGVNTTLKSRPTARVVRSSCGSTIVACPTLEFIHRMSMQAKIFVTARRACRSPRQQASVVAPALFCGAGGVIVTWSDYPSYSVKPIRASTLHPAAVQNGSRVDHGGCRSQFAWWTPNKFSTCERRGRGSRRHVGRQENARCRYLRSARRRGGYAPLDDRWCCSVPRRLHSVGTPGSCR